MKRFILGTALLCGATLFTGTAGAAEMEMGWYGGPVYTGAPALTVTAALVEAGGGAANFSFPKALVSMLGEKTVNAEVATAKGVKLPAAPADLKGAKLAKTLAEAGMAKDGTWWSGLLFDKALSHPIHIQVMVNIESKYSRAYDKNVHKILDQAMYDVAQALKVKDVKLAPLATES